VQIPTPNANVSIGAGRLDSDKDVNFAGLMNALASGGDHHRRERAVYHRFLHQRRR
jgi:hypothetical protein